MKININVSKSKLAKILLKDISEEIDRMLDENDELIKKQEDYKRRIANMETLITKIDKLVPKQAMSSESNGRVPKTLKNSQNARDAKKAGDLDKLKVELKQLKADIKDCKDGKAIKAEKAKISNTMRLQSQEIKEMKLGNERLRKQNAETAAKIATMEALLKAMQDAQAQRDKDYED